MQEIDDNSTSRDRGEGTRRGFTMPWSALSLVLLIVALASIGSLVVVATIVDADTLATVALVLAILSFGAQLIVTAAQTASANEQYRQVNRLYEDSRSVLQRIRAQSKMLLSNQSDQFNKILDHVLSPGAIESAVAEARGDTDDTPLRAGEGAPAPTDVNEVSKLLRAEAERALVDDRSKRVVEVGRRAPILEEIHRFPAEEAGREIAGKYQALGDEAKAYIKAIADRFLTNSQSSLRISHVIRTSKSELPQYVRELETSGFLTLDPMRHDGHSYTVRRLTPLGVVAIRFFTGRGVVPSYLRELLGEGDAA